MAPQAKDASLWILTWEEVRRIHHEGMLLEVEPQKCNERAGDMAKERPNTRNIFTVVG